MPNKKMEIVVYSWNTQASFFDNESGEILKDIDKQINEKTQLIVVALQEAVKPGSQFVSLILPTHLSALGFTQLQRSRLMGVGVTTYHSLQNFDLRFRGLRLAVYARQSWMDEENLQPSEEWITEKWCYCEGLYQYSLGKGGLAFVLEIPNFEKLTIINVHLPFSAPTLLDSKLRQESVEWQSQALAHVWKNLVQSQGPGSVILIGDLNYRVCLGPDETSNDLYFGTQIQIDDIYRQRDELKAELDRSDSILPKLREGVYNLGPRFMPTAKLLSSDRTRYNIGKTGRRAPSWCDRILLYSDSLTCLNYERCALNKATRMSDHASIIAKIEFQSLDS